jgi:hypothetical protein
MKAREFRKNEELREEFLELDIVVNDETSTMRLPTHNRCLIILFDELQHLMQTHGEE